ncbi:Membrane-bound lysozyme-inhibitor of c-type lysozyme [compost metagenome]
MRIIGLLGITSICMLTACTEPHVITRTRNLEFNCSNDFKVTFTERIEINLSDTTEKITVAVKSPDLKGDFSMKQARAASGVRYVSEDGKYVFWEHQGEFTFGTEDSTYCLCK